MPYSTHVTHCHACGSEYICGDCITLCCDDCREAGHDSGFASGCRKCEKERLTNEAKMRAKLIDLGYDPDTLERI